MSSEESEVVSILQTIRLALHLRPVETSDTIIKDVATRLMRTHNYENIKDIQALTVFKHSEYRAKAFEIAWGELCQQRTQK